MGVTTTTPARTSSTTECRGAHGHGASGRGRGHARGRSARSRGPGRSGRGRGSGRGCSSGHGRGRSLTSLHTKLQKWTVVEDDTFSNKLTFEKDYLLADYFEANIKEVHQNYMKEMQHCC